MAGIVKEFRTYYQTDEDPRFRPNRFVTVVVADRLDGTFEFTEREGDTAPEPEFHGEDELAGISIGDENAMQKQFQDRCAQLEGDGWRLYRGE